jgi:hypothetical protein
MGLTYKILCSVAFVCVLLLSILSLYARKVKRRLTRKDPFCEARMRPAGESLRLKLLDLDEEWTFAAIWLAGCGGFSFLVLSSLSSTSMESPIGVLVKAFLLSAGFAGVLVFTVKVWLLQTKTWAVSLGFDGERYVGQVLTDALVPLGCRVFHDLPFDGFNVDHLVISPSGVFVVETKTYSKPINPRTGKADYKITYDGKRLAFPRKTSLGNELGQTEFITKKVAEWLSGETGRAVPSRGVLLFPGWFVEVTGNSSLVVANPNPKFLIPRLFPNGVACLNNGEPLDSTLYNRILYLVTQKATIEETK